MKNRRLFSKGQRGFHGRWKRKFRGFCLVVLFCIALSVMVAWASDSMDIMKTYKGKDLTTLQVSGLGKDFGITLQIGTVVGDKKNIISDWVGNGQFEIAVLSDRVLLKKMIDPMPQQVVAHSVKSETKSGGNESFAAESQTIVSLGFFIGIMLFLLLVFCGIWIYKKKRIEDFEEFLEESEDWEIRSQNIREQTMFVERERHLSGEDDGTYVIWDLQSFPSIVLTDVHSPSKTFHVLMKDSVVIGRKTECDIVLAYDRSVSGKHCKIIAQGKKFYIEDLHSLNGTFVNNVPVRTKTSLFAGNVIKLGEIELKFYVKK